MWIERPRVVEDLRALLAEIDRRARRDSTGDDFPAASAPCVRDCNRPAPQGTGAGRKCGPQGDYCLKLETTAVEAGEPLKRGSHQKLSPPMSFWNISSVGHTAS